MYLEEEECEKYTGNKFEYYLNLTGIHGLLMISFLKMQ